MLFVDMHLKQAVTLLVFIDYAIRSSDSKPSLASCKPIKQTESAT